METTLNYSSDYYSGIFRTRRIVLFARHNISCARLIILCAWYVISCAHNLSSHAHNLSSHAHNVSSHAHNLSSYALNLLSLCAQLIILCAQLIISCAQLIISCAQHIITCCPLAIRPSVSTFHIFMLSRITGTILNIASSEEDNSRVFKLNSFYKGKILLRNSKSTLTIRKKYCPELMGQF